MIKVLSPLGMIFVIQLSNRLALKLTRKSFKIKFSQNREKLKKQIRFIFSFLIWPVGLIKIKSMRLYISTLSLSWINADEMDPIIISLIIYFNHLTSLIIEMRLSLGFSLGLIEKFRNFRPIKWPECVHLGFYKDGQKIQVTPDDPIPTFLSEKCLELFWK